MIVAAGESLQGEFDDEFDLDVRIDDLDPAEPERIHRAQSVVTSCTMCCETFFCTLTWHACPSTVCTGIPCN